MDQSVVFDPLEPRTLFSSTPAVFTPPADPRITVNLDPGWKFTKSNPSGAGAKTFNDAAWSSINVPHTWNNLDGQDGGSNYYRGIGWYRKHFIIPTSMSGKEIFLRFDGSDIDTTIYVNGTLAGSHSGGFAGFDLDITSFVKVGTDNTFAVKVSNAYDPNVAPLSGDFNMDGGIYRDVSLIATTKTHIGLLDYGSPGVYLTPTNVSATSANVGMRTILRNDSTASASFSVETDIVNATGALVASTSSSKTIASKVSSTLSQALIVTNPHLWNGVADPYLYATYVIVRSAGLVVDRMIQPLGLRFFKVDPKLGFFLNGKPYDLHGGSIDEDRAGKGWAISDADRTQDISLIQELGATFVRLAHYQFDQTTYNLLDQDGIVTWSELPLVNSASTATGFVSNIRHQLIEMIRQNYNHPSVFFWSLFNEIPSNNTSFTVVSQLNTLAHTEDPTRMTTGATFPTNGDNSKLLTLPDTVGSNRYYGWYGGSTSDLGPWVDSFHAAHPNIAIAISEYGTGANVTQHEANPSNIVTTGQWHPEEDQDLIHEQLWPQLAARPYIWVKSIWGMFDFASDLRNEGGTPGINDKGLVTYDRTTKKDAFYYYKAQWSSSPFVYITSRRWTQRTDTITDIKIYSNCASVELFVNGQSEGQVSATNHVFIWQGITLSSGDNVIQAVPVSGETAATDQVTWTLTPSPPPPPPQLPPPLPLPPDSVQSSLTKDLIDGESEEV